ncbi:MAG TPA: tetratricopeptide repeat protein [Chitinispirillaceae bacterium]|jgi:tetratricopeptide (TPR) repeat protein|nr:tetratricopeptide repeat protein [Chitinispirillaceae bacterium]
MPGFKFIPKLKLSSSELHLIKKVTLISLSASVLLISLSWGYHFIRIKIKSSAAVSRQKSLELLPIDLQAHHFTARSYMRSGTPEKAIPHLLRIIPLRKYDLEVRKDLANAYLESGHYEESLEQYDFLSEQQLPDSLAAEVCARRGIALYYSGHVEQSISSLSECLSRYPTSAKAACFLGQIEASLRPKSPKILDYLEQALRIDSSNVEALYQMARYYMQLNDHLKARMLLLQAIEIDPLHAKSHSRLGMVYYYLSKPDLAKASYQTALAINPDDFNTRYNFGELYYSLINDTALALEEYKKAVTQYPGHVEANFKIGLICMRNGMLKEAIRYFEQAVKNDQNNTRILLQLAVAYEKLEVIDKAKETYHRILSIDDLNSIARQKIRLLAQSE